MKMEDFRTRVEGNEFRVELTPDFYLIPINTGIRDLEDSDTLTFSCGIYLGNVYMRQGSCWP